MYIDQEPFNLAMRALEGTFVVMNKRYFGGVSSQVKNSSNLPI